VIHGSGVATRSSPSPEHERATRPSRLLHNELDNARLALGGSAPLVPSTAPGLGLAAPRRASRRQASMSPLVGNLQFCRAARGAGGEYQLARAVD
jgi:hypothetical protein